MTKKDWVTAALANDTIVAEFLICMKQPSTTSTSTSLFPRITWGYRKSRSKEQQNGSPTTPLYWNASTSDGYEDVSSGGTGRSIKDGLGNEGAITSSRKRKSFTELKAEQDFLMKERLHLNRELESMRVTMINQIAISQNLKKFKIGMHQNPKKENHGVQTACVIPKTKAHETGFVLPDLNMVPDDEEIYRI